MAVLTEGRHAGEFLLSEANGTLSRDTIAVAAGENLEAGAVVERNGSGKAVAYTGESDSDIAGVLFDAVDATDGEVAGAVIIARLAEVKESAISVENDDTPETIKAAAIVALKTLDIVAR